MSMSDVNVKWTEFPLVDLDPRYRKLSNEEFLELASECGEEAALGYFEARETRVRHAQGYFLKEGKWQFEPDPLRFGFDLPHWPIIRELLKQKEEVYVFGGNDSAKTTLMAKIAIEVLTRRFTWPGMMAGAPQVLCVAQNDTMSKRVQQKMVYQYLPVELRRFNDSGTPKRRSTVTKMTYSIDQGFTNASFSMAYPRGSACLFRNVTQYERQELGVEGDYFHLIVVDESCPLALLETLRFRAAKVGGRILYVFTPVSGFDAVCNNVFTGARLVKSLPMQWSWETEGRIENRHLTPALSPASGGEGEVNDGAQGTARPTKVEVCGIKITGGVNPELQFPEIDLTKQYVDGCPAGHMPFIMQPLDFNKAIVFTWSHWNPFPVRAKFNRFLPKIADKCIGRGHRVSLFRLFGYTDKLATAQVPNFKPDYYPKGHLIRHAELLELLAKEPHNLRCGDDPATARSHFIGWKAVLPNGLDDRPMQYLVWESPTMTEGEWVTPDGERGDGQRLHAEWGVDEYKAYIRQIEATLGHPFVKDEPDPVLRSGDPRGFAANMGDGSTKYFELFLRDDSDKDPLLAPMYFRPAGVKATIRQDVQYDGKLMDLLACDWDKPIDATNKPHLLISDACRNTITALLNCPENEPNSPYKDPLDMTRYLFDIEVPYVNVEENAVVGGGAWG